MAKKMGSDKFYTVPFKGETARFDGIIVPAQSKSSAKRTANIHAQNMGPTPPSIKKSETHVSTAKEITLSNKWGEDKGPGQTRFVIANERIQ